MFQKFRSYDPYLTFSNTLNTCLIGYDGEEILDTESLFNLGIEAYKNIGLIQSKEVFDEVIASYLEIIEAWRKALPRKNITCKSPVGKEFILDWSKAEDCQIVNAGWQIYSKQQFPVNDSNKVVHAELFLILALIEIDYANMNTIIDSVVAVGSAIEAANAFSNAIAIISENEKLQDIRKDFAYRGAIARIERDPKQHDKKFVYKCWQEWQENPKRYRSKAAFARDMIDKCEHIVSNKKIEDWCRKWGKPNPAS